MHVQSNGGWLGVWLGGWLVGWCWPAGRPKPPTPAPPRLAQLHLGETRMLFLISVILVVCFHDLAIKAMERWRGFHHLVILPTSDTSNAILGKSIVPCAVKYSKIAQSKPKKKRKKESA